MAVSRVDLASGKGLSGVGRVIDLGTQVNGLFPGDRVAWLSREPIAYADICLAASRDCIPLPEGITDLHASTLAQGLSAGLLLSRVFRAGPGSTLFIENVSAGLGHILSQWARSLDIVVIGTAPNRDAARFARDRGCNHPIVAGDAASIRDEVMRISNGQGVDFMACDGGIMTPNDAMACLARFGHLAWLGEGQGDFCVDNLRKRSLTISAPDCLDYYRDRLYMQRMAGSYFGKVQSGLVTPVMEVMPLIQAGDAHHKLESGQVMGALCLAP